MKKLLLLITICLTAQFLLMSRLVVYGDSVSGLEDKISSLKEENQKLELSLASQISCSAIAQRAAEVGSRADLSVALKR